MNGNEPKKPIKKKIIEILGYLVSFAALYFVYRYVVNIDLEAAKQKISYLQNIAKSNVFDTKWDEKTDSEAIDILCTIKGVGKWTAEMFLIFHLARPNILPLGDVGLIKGIEKHYNNSKKMTPSEIIKLKELWDPWCSVFTWYIWRSLDPIPVNY